MKIKKWKKIENIYDKLNGRIKFVKWQHEKGFYGCFYEGIDPNEIKAKGER